MEAPGPSVRSLNGRGRKLTLEVDLNWRREDEACAAEDENNLNVSQYKCEYDVADIRL